ncbi:MAG: DUF1080 domain-containing protein [Chitinophagaceae bacterium]|nr:MAG: DUF1080 domain-containing protein [Chitinophagaceae bacterium]
MTALLIRTLLISAIFAFPIYHYADGEKQQGFDVLFDGTNLDKWTGNKTDYVIEDGNIVLHPENKGGGNLYTAKEYGDFEFQFEFKLIPGANNGVGIRTKLTGDAAYDGMEIQILDNDDPQYKDLHEYQFHGSVYGVIPAKRGFLKPTGEWNSQTIIAKGNHIQVILNGEKILDGDIKKASEHGTMDKQKHPGLFNKKGHIGFLYHETTISFRNVKVKEM